MLLKYPTHAGDSIAMGCPNSWMIQKVVVSPVKRMMTGATPHDLGSFGTKSLPVLQEVWSSGEQHRCAGLAQSWSFQLRLAMAEIYHRNVA